MVITKTPYRVSLFGGGTDFPDWYRKFGGEVLSFAIKKYCYISIKNISIYSSHKYKVVYSLTEVTNDLDQIRHPAVREGIRKYASDARLEIHHYGDLPARSGVGSSSAFAVGLILALHNLKKQNLSKISLAQEAIHLEQIDLKENVGSQDQIACTYGGFNKIEFKTNGEFKVNHVPNARNLYSEIEMRTCLVYSKISRNSSDISKKLVQNLQSNNFIMNQNQKITESAAKIFFNQGNLDDIGDLLNENFKIKVTLNPDAYTDALREIYNQGIRAGALGGKVLGAGGGGFLLFWLRRNELVDFRNKMSNFQTIPVELSQTGSELIMV